MGEKTYKGILDSELKGHLASTSHNAVTADFEWTIIRFHEAFQRYCVQVAHVSGLGSLSFAEIVLLHVICMQERPATAALLARQLNTDAISNVQYGLRKFVTAGLINKLSESGGKVVTYEATAKGSELTRMYAQVRQAVLTEQTATIANIDSKLADSTRLLSLLTGLYEEASRISATYNFVPVNKN